MSQQQLAGRTKLDIVSHLVVVNQTVVHRRHRVEPSHSVIDIAYKISEVCAHKCLSRKQAVVLYWESLLTETFL